METVNELERWRKRDEENRWWSIYSGYVKKQINGVSVHGQFYGEAHDSRGPILKTHNDDFEGAIRGLVEKIRANFFMEYDNERFDENTVRLR